RGGRYSSLRRPGRFGLLLAAYGLFLLLGAAVFAVLEAPAERALVTGLQAARASLLAEHRPCLAEEQLAGLLGRLLAAGGYADFALSNGSADPAWEFTSALFFVTSALTTTGYGNMVPLSDWGKIISIFYCFVGIPVTIFFIQGLLRYLLPILTYRPVQYIHSRWGLPQGHVAIGHSIGLGLATLILFILIPAVCFWVLKDNWTFLESIYFCFISLSTIGLGDFTPRNFKVTFIFLFPLFIGYLLTGLLAMLVTLETIYQLQEIHALVRFFAPSRRQRLEEDRVGIVTRDQLALTSNLGPCSPKTN
uniref:Potassium channel domain-containing protein n=1 Tax=Pseudonaja textilis TaxID=8673 RepID=A0A670Z4K1_PSETE